MVTYELAGNALRSKIVVENPDNRPLPWGLGTHPYFRVPLVFADRVTNQGEAGCQITVPAREYWELVDMLPTGKRPADDQRNLASGIAFAETQLDNVFAGLTSASSGECIARIVDPRAECTSSR